ncbi:MAG: GNAT family N-acetyltransferase [bacterium]
MTDSRFPSSEIKIVDFHPSYASDFRDINYEWLEELFEVEPYDRVVLNDPQTHIIDQGGFVFLAEVDGAIVGTCALLRHTEKKYELAKMGVTKDYRSRGIGRRLVEAAIERARRLQATKLILATSNQLPAANHLYQAMGFQYADLAVIGPLPYQRETIVMALDL